MNKRTMQTLAYLDSIISEAHDLRQVVSKLDLLDKGEAACIIVLLKDADESLSEALDTLSGNAD
jgi:hypothetical protein